MLTVAEPAVAPSDRRVLRREPVNPRRAEGLITALVGAVPVSAAILIAVAGGAWGIARTDDWAFARVAFELHRTGHVHLVGWAQMNLVGLVAWVQPWLWMLGDHVWVLDLASSVLVGLGLAAAYRVARTVLSPRLAVVAVGMVVVFPGFLRDVPSFMTDAPAFAIQAIVLAVGMRALAASGRRRTVLFAGVALLGFWGFTVREFAIAAPLAVLGAAYLRAVRADRRRLGAGIIGLLAVSAAFYLWRAGLPGQQPPVSRLGVFVASVVFWRAVCTLALGLVPVLALTVRSWWHPVSARARKWGCAFAAAAIWIGVAASRRVLVGDYLDRRGVDAAHDTLGLRPALVPTGVWIAISVVAALATIVVAGLVAEWVVSKPVRRTTEARVLVLHIGVLAAATAAAALVNGHLFDRYLWPVVLSASILMLRKYDVAPAPRVVATASALAAGALALLLAVNSAAFDGARWEAATALTRQGLPAQSVEAGFEWYGAHSTGIAQPGTYKIAGDLAWWSDWYPHPASCALVTSSPIAAPGYVLSGSRSWNLLLFAAVRHLSVYRSTSPACATSG